VVRADCGPRTLLIGLQEHFRESLQMCSVFVEMAKATSRNPLSDVRATPQVVLKRPTALAGAARCRRNSLFESRKTLRLRLYAFRQRRWWHGGMNGLTDGFYS